MLHPLQAPATQNCPTGQLPGWPSEIGVLPHFPATQVAVLHPSVGGHSVGDWQPHVRLPVRSFGPQRPEQHVACSRQIVPNPVQVRASVPRHPNRLRAPAAKPRSKRRREPGVTSDRVSESKCEPSNVQPFQSRATLDDSVRETVDPRHVQLGSPASSAMRKEAHSTASDRRQ